MCKQSSLKKRHSSLKKALQRNLEKKRFVEMVINKQWRELKKLEISIEKMRGSYVKQNGLSKLLMVESAGALQTRDIERL